MTHSASSTGLALASQRHLFEIPDDVTFLNCAYISPLPKASLIAGDRGLRCKAQPWTIGAADFFTSSETVRKLFADLINADADDVAFAPAVSYGMAQAAHNIPVRRARRIVTVSEQFPSNKVRVADEGLAKRDEIGAPLRDGLVGAHFVEAVIGHEEPAEEPLDRQIVKGRNGGPARVALDHMKISETFT